MKYLDRRWLSVAAGGLMFVAILTTSTTSILADEIKTNTYDSDSVVGSPIQTALAELPTDIREYNDHITFLADPFCSGRLPGTPGMEVAMQYMEYYFKRAGLVPAFKKSETDANSVESVRPMASWRQPFPLGSTTTVTREVLATRVAENELSLTSGEDFKVLTYGGSGDVAGPVVFVGYSVEDGPDGYSSYDDDTDLTGKIALMFRFEPVDDEGNSRWSDGRWSSRAGFSEKISGAVQRGAAGIIIMNPPGVNDPRAQSVQSGGSARPAFDLPVALMSTQAADAFVRSADPEGRSLADLRMYADEGGEPFEMGNASVRLVSEVTTESSMAENVGGILPGRGALADEYIVIGAHLDHLGNGEFGSRRGAGQLHPGADDNASGSAGILLIADKLAEAYGELPDDADLRSILFIAFSGEESGLNGSSYYVRNPIVPLEKHVLMMNFDMIGRILNHRLSVSGANTADGFSDFLQPIFDESELEIVQSNGMAGSDHLPFYRAEMPILFAIIADFHADYHTPDDVSWKINRVDAVKACNLWTRIALESARIPEFFKFGGSGRTTERRGADASRAQIKVRVGIVPDYGGQGKGVLVSDITPESSASEGGIKAEDRIVKWNGKDVEDLRTWMGMLSSHEPGDKVEVVVVRDGREVALTLTLQAREGQQGGGQDTGSRDDRDG